MLACLVPTCANPHFAATIPPEATLSNKPWGGVFDQATDRRVEKFTQSVNFDHRLYAQDICGSIAHALMLAKVGVLTDAERHQIVTCLEQIHQEIDAGKFPFQAELEDVHMNIERALVDHYGEAIARAVCSENAMRPLSTYWRGSPEG